MVCAPRSLAGSSGTCAETPPSMKLHPSTVTGGNTPGIAALARTWRRSSPARNAAALPVGRWEGVTRAAGCGGGSDHRRGDCQLRMGLRKVPLDDSFQARRRRQHAGAGERPQGTPPPEAGEDVFASQLAPDAGEIVHALCVESAPDEARVERAGRGADEEIRLDLRLEHGPEHAHLDRSEARTPREDECNRAGTAEPFHEDSQPATIRSRI